MAFYTTLLDAGYSKTGCSLWMKMAIRFQILVKDNISSDLFYFSKLSNFLRGSGEGTS